MAVIGKAQQQDLPAIGKLAISIFAATYEAHNNPEDFKAYMQRLDLAGRLGAQPEGHTFLSEAWL